MTKRRWTVPILGIAVFLAAFGVAFASQHHPTWQVWQNKGGTAALNPLVTLSSGDILVSFDGTGAQQVASLEFKVEPSLGRSVGQTVWFHNNTDAVNLRPIDPCQDAIRSSDGAVIGRVEAELWDAAGNPRGSTCDDEWPADWVVTPGGTWRMMVWLEASGDLMTDGDGFNVVFAAVGAPLARIAFASTRVGPGNEPPNWEIYVMNGDGTNQINLTNLNHHAADSSPAWSPNGDKIAFASNGRDISTGGTPFPDPTIQIYVMDTDGTNQTRLTNTGNNQTPAWSPDGNKIAFGSNRDGNYEIYAMNGDGTDQTRLSTSDGGDIEPAWSPDSSKIAFRSDRDGNGEIYVMNADGSDQTRLTDNPAFDAYPSWSPDGSKIAFESRRDVNFGSFEIYVMNADGSGQTRLTNTPAGRYPAWSPDGNKIAFSSFIVNDRNWDVYVINPDGSNQTRLTDDPAVDESPDWSPGVVPP